MSQSTITISCDQTGTAYTVDINAALAAIDTAHAGDSAPTTNLADGKMWLDTSGSDNVIKMRVGASFVELFNLNGGVWEAAAATKLATARTIGGVSFDGTANINLPGVNASGTQNTSGVAATATKLATSRTISISGDATGSASFDGTGNAGIAISLASDSVNSNEIATDAVGSSEIAANAVGNSEMADNAVGLAELSASGTASASTFLRGDNTWTAPEGGGATPASHSEFTANGTLSMTGFKGFIALISGGGGAGGCNSAGGNTNSQQPGKGGNGGLAFMSRAGTSGNISITVGGGGGDNDCNGDATGAGGSSSSVTFSGTVTAGGGSGGGGSNLTGGNSGSGNAGNGAGAQGGGQKSNNLGGIGGQAGSSGRVTIVRFN